MALDADIKTVLWTEADIATRVAELASQISDDFLGSSSSLVAVGVATGAFLFLADVVRRIKLPIEVDFIRAESYGAGTESSGALRISCDLKIDVAGKHVILVCFYGVFFFPLIYADLLILNFNLYLHFVEKVSILIYFGWPFALIDDIVFSQTYVCTSFSDSSCRFECCFSCR